MNTCKICNSDLKSKRAKTCDSNKCKSKWKMERNKNLSPVSKPCNNCGTTFQTIDKRNNFCSNECRVDSRHYKMINKYGQKSLTSSWESRKEKTIKTMQDKYNGSSKRYKYLKARGFNNVEDLARAIHSFCKENNIAPNSKTCLDHFNISTYVNRILTEYGFSDVLHNSYRNSQQEIEIQDFIKSLNINFESNYRPEFLNKKELDIFIPKYNLAIEFHGLAHHSERPIYREYSDTGLLNQKTIHRFKYEKCKENGISLVQIFEDEWKNKRDIIKSIIKNKLNKSTSRLYARSCVVQEVSNIKSNQFFEDNHISGSVKSLYSLGLYYQEELVCCIAFRKTWNKKYGDNTIEIARFASTLNTNVLGGFSRLLKHSIKTLKERGFKTILTYADRRFGSGEVYKINGFTHIGNTGANYFYEKGGIRESRFRHRKNNDLEYIKEYGNSEREQNNNRGWYAIYDAGNEIYTLAIK